MILKPEQRDILKQLIEKFELHFPKADLFFKNHIRRYNLSKEDRFFLMDLFYYYLRNRLLLRRASSDLGKDWINVLTQYYHQQVDEELLAWQSTLERREYQRLSLSVDDWWFEQIESVFSTEEIDLLLSYLQSRAPTTLLTLLRRNPRSVLEQKLRESDLDVKPLLMPSALAVSGRLRNHENLFFDVQDHSSQLMALLLPKDTSSMLDYCAGHGGKSIAFASTWDLLQVVASDIRDELKESVEQRAKRAGIKLRWKRKRDLVKERFPFVVVDAPCSGSGVWRRNPEDRYRFSSKEVIKLSQTQLAILMEAGKLVESGGEILYITCSISPVENENVIEQFLQKTKQFSIIDVRERLQNNANYLGLEYDQILSYLQTQSFPFLRITPQRSGGDLFFACLLKKVKL